jgi:hypothetical protein
MVVDVDQSRGENVLRAVDNIGVVPDEVAPAAAGPRRENSSVPESNEGVGAVNT